MELHVIAYARNGHTDKFGIPRQSREESPILTRIVFEEKYNIPEALRGIEGFSHLWILWGFSENFPNENSEQHQPPKLLRNTSVQPLTDVIVKQKMAYVGMPFFVFRVILLDEVSAARHLGFTATSATSDRHL